MKLLTQTVTLVLMLVSTVVFAGPDDAAVAGTNRFPVLKNAVILIIRHAEKPASGNGLTPAGERRATAYVNYFKNLTIDGQPVKLDYLFAAADSKNSRRPRLTITPTSKALGLAIDSRFSDKDCDGIASEIESKSHGTSILIAWHHGEIPELLSAFGADPDKVLPNGEWPETVFGWMIVLRYDADGRLIKARRINEKLMPTD